MPRSPTLRVGRELRETTKAYLRRSCAKKCREGPLNPRAFGPAKSVAKGSTKVSMLDPVKSMTRGRPKRL